MITRHRNHSVLGNAWVLALGRCSLWLWRRDQVRGITARTRSWVRQLACSITYRKSRPKSLQERALTNGQGT